jgi:tetratricopeptide (TPR) repeat protein
MTNINRRFLVLALTVCVAGAAGAADKNKGGSKQAAKGPSTQDQFAEADQKVAAGDLDGAVTVLQAAAAQDETGEASLRLGRVLEVKYDLDLAVDAYTAAAAKLSGGPKGEALARLSGLQDLKLSPTAAATADEASAADPGGVWPTIALARVRAREGKGAEALDMAQKAVAGGGGPVATSVLAAAQAASGDLAAAESSFRSVLDEAPSKIEAHIGLAQVLRKAGRPGEAVPLLQQVLALAPGAVRAYAESARVKLALNHPGDAVGDAATAAALAENNPEAQRLVQEVAVAQALVDIATGKADLAIQSLTALSEKEPTAAAPHVGLAKAQIAKRQADAAIAELRKALELEPDSVEAHYELGYVQHVFKGNPAAALPEYEKAVAADPGNQLYRTNLGAALVALKDYDRAVDELGKVTGATGHDRAEAWIYLGQAHLGAKRYKDAIAALEKALAIAPESDQVNAFLAWAYFGLKDSANFKKYGAKAKALGYKEATLLQYLGRIQAGEAIK